MPDVTENRMDIYWGDYQWNNGKLEWIGGEMHLNLDAFFPVNLAKFKKLLKVIALDEEHSEKLIEDLKVYFQNQIVECTETAKQSARDYGQLKTQVSELEMMVKTRKKPVGVYLTQPELSKTKEDLSKRKEQTAKALSSYKVNTANVKKFQRLLEELNR